MEYIGEPTSVLKVSDEDKLDIEFRQVLYAIKQYIPYVNSNYQLSMYRSWLETLSISDCEKTKRNKYLIELSRQIQNKTLLPPFDRLPSTGSLRSLPKIKNFRESFSEIPTHNNLNWPVSEDEEQASQSTVSYLDQNYSTELSYYTDEQQLSENQADSYLSSPNQQTLDYQNPLCPMEPVDSFYYKPLYTEKVNEPLAEKPASAAKNKKRKPKSARSLQPVAVEMNSPKDVNKNQSSLNPSREMSKNDEVPKANENEQDVNAVKDESSWCDLTDASATSIVNALASGDADKNIQTVQKVDKCIEITKISNDHKTAVNIGDIEIRSAEVEKSISSLVEEVESLKYKESNYTKYGLKDTNFISADWKKTIESLQLRLTETLNQNNELKAVINTLQKKIRDDAAKNNNQNDAKQQIPFDTRSKEIEVLKQIQEDNVRKFEKSFQIKLDEAEKSYQQKIDNIKTSYDIKIRDLKSQHESTKRSKDRELSRLTQIIQQQCMRMTSEIAALRSQVENSLSNTSDDKIIVLQKCVSKMDKLFQRTEKDYQRQIEKLKQDLTMKDRVMQIQLKTQRAELITRTSVEKQRQFDDVVNTLEIKYIQMLEYHENQVMESKQQDEDKIEHLKELLDKNDIPYDCVL